MIKVDTGLDFKCKVAKLEDCARYRYDFDLRWLNKGLKHPTIKFTNIDGMVERHGYALVVEYKSDKDIQTPQGQDIAFINLTARSPAIVVWVAKGKRPHNPIDMLDLTVYSYGKCKHYGLQSMYELDKQVGAWEIWVESMFEKERNAWI